MQLKDFLNKYKNSLDKNKSSSNNELNQILNILEQNNLNKLVIDLKNKSLFWEQNTILNNLAKWCLENILISLDNPISISIYAALLNNNEEEIKQMLENSKNDLMKKVFEMSNLDKELDSNIQKR